jgi:hypothetical protein
MQMIDVLKRLAQLDAQNPTIVKESSEIAECGMMPEMSMDTTPSQPASINIQAGSGEELGDMLKTIMSLAGIHKVEPEHLGVDHEPMQLTPEPGMAVGPAASAGDNMRAVLDKLHPEMGDEEETDEEAGPQYDTTPNDAEPEQAFGANQFSNQENQADQGDRMDGTMPKANAEEEPKKEAYADMNEAVADLFAQYKQFVSE